MNEKTPQSPVLANGSEDAPGKFESSDKQWKWQGGDFSPNDSWSPMVNVYQIARRVEVCIDLAGMDVSKVDLLAQKGVLVIRGVRLAPAPRQSPDEACRIMSMEILHGSFCCEIVIPEQLDLSRMTKRYDEGYLWVTLPMRTQG